MLGHRTIACPKTRNHGRSIQVMVLLGGLLLWGSSFAGDAPEILRIRHFSGPQKTRVVLDVSGSTSFEVSEISNPHRLVINLPRCVFANSASIPVNDGLVDRVRRNPGKKRAQVVLDLVGEYEFHAFSLPSENGNPHRVVLDVLRPVGSVKEAAPEVPVTTAPLLDLPFVVVIDPGHGGLDPGAVRGKTREKDIVLAVSLELARLLNSLPGYRAVLTRDGDYYPNLARRVEIAAEEGGDLFMSVHCNTHNKKQIRGMEVYFLSLQGATDHETRELAHKENAADLVGLDHQKNKNDLVLSILMDMRMTRILHESARLAEQLLVTADASTVVKKRKAKQAGFQVLRSLAMPSTLVEIAYLSNSEDLKILKSVQGRDQLASLLAEGIVAWRNDRAGLAMLKGHGSGHWMKQYAVRQGDSLWGLAHSHHTTIQEISSRNQLHSQALLVGQVLLLPRDVQEP